MCLVGFGNTSQRMSKKVIDTLYSTCLALTDEMFDTNGMELRAGTVGNPNYAPEGQLENPYPMTFLCTLGNGHLGYVPSQLGYHNGGYSTDIAYLAPGSGERLVSDYLAILQELHRH